MTACGRSAGSRWVREALPWTMTTRGIDAPIAKGCRHPLPQLDVAAHEDYGQPETGTVSLHHSRPLRSSRSRFLSSSQVNKTETETRVSFDHEPDETWIAARLKIPHEFSVRLASLASLAILAQEENGERPPHGRATVQPAAQPGGPEAGRRGLGTHEPRP